MSTRISEYQALRQLQAGGEPDVFVTIPEGFTLAQIAARLQDNLLCSRQGFLSAAQDSVLLARLGIPGKSAEGFLFPARYRLAYGLAPEQIIEIMHRKFLAVYRQIVDSLAKSRQPAHQTGPVSRPGDSERPQLEVVILASLVEAEAKLDSERPIVASVFTNRLARGMPLQSCASVEYVLPERRAVLSEADLLIDSPYNTYRHLGLPPGPICNPGRVSLRAAIAPAKTNYLYFVARGDGSHFFSATFGEHASAKRRFGQRAVRG